MRANNLTLLTDLYELTMMQGYFKNPTNQTVIFDMFYRTNPCGGAFAITAGLEQMIEYIENLKFTDEDIEYLRSLNIFEEDFLEYLSNFRFTGDIYAIPEGTVVFPREPLVKVVAPIMEAQLVETAILNIINHQSLIATKAARVCYAAKGDAIMEFGLRRAQGPDAGIFGARAAVIGGCAGTSCVLTGKMFDVPVLGTHAHSWIMSFPDEYTAFKTYAKLYPNACTLLVDHQVTYIDATVTRGSRKGDCAKRRLRLRRGPVRSHGLHRREHVRTGGIQSIIILRTGHCIARALTPPRKATLDALVTDQRRVESRLTEQFDR